jgi:hypothetical protein
MAPRQPSALLRCWRPAQRRTSRRRKPPAQFDARHGPASGDTALEWDNPDTTTPEIPIMLFPTALQAGTRQALLAAVMLACAPVVGRAEVCSAIRHEIVNVQAQSAEWTSAALKIQPNDVILVYAGGRVSVGGDATRTVSAKGLPNGTGALEMKVGTGTVVPAGTRWFGSFRDYGTLKFRIAAERRAELKGSYKVNLVVIPADSFPDAVTLGAE